MAIIITFLLGIGNFAWHSAVLGSGHRMIGDMPDEHRQMIRWSSMSLEFVLLCAALYGVNAGHTLWMWVYMGYSAINGGAAWLILKNRF